MTLLTEIVEGMRIAWEAIRANKMRSALTTLGIVIGITTVTLMGTAIEGVNRSFRASMSVYGPNTLQVSRFSWASFSHDEWLRAQKRRPITLLQARAVQRLMTLASAVSPVSGLTQPVYYRNRSSNKVQILGSNEQFLNTSGFSIGEGRFISEAESESGRAVCVIGLDVANNLFHGEPPLGKRIRIGSCQFEVIGILARQGSFMGIESMDNEVIIPIRQLMLHYLRDPEVQIWVSIAQSQEMDLGKEELQGVLRKVRRLSPGQQDDFSINEKEQLIGMFKKITGMIGGVGLVITGLALFVGGIGIMNIMFVSVAERTREIGVRKAIGAKRRTILLQFLSEAAGICLIGGVLGLALTWVLTLIISRFFPATMSLPIMGLAIGVSLATGLIAGFLPAWRAARMDPVEALRKE